MDHELIKILLVEDNDLDVEKIERGLKRLNIKNPLIRATDGQDALDKLRGVGGTPPVSEPYIIILDLNMPRMSGLEFLEELRNDPVHKTARVFVLTTSDRPKDIDGAYAHNVTGYIVKPLAREQLLKTLSALDAYWQLIESPGTA